MSGDEKRARDVTRILQQDSSGAPQQAQQLLPLVYEELRALARARMAQESGDAAESIVKVEST